MYESRLLLLLLFLTFSVLVANPKKLLYTVANPARGLLNREKLAYESRLLVYESRLLVYESRLLVYESRLLVYQDYLCMNRDYL